MNEPLRFSMRAVLLLITVLSVYAAVTKVEPILGLAITSLAVALVSTAIAQTASNSYTKYYFSLNNPSPTTAIREK